MKKYYHFRSLFFLGLSFLFVVYGLAFVLIPQEKIGRVLGENKTAPEIIETGLPSSGSLTGRILDESLQPVEKAAVSIKGDALVRTFASTTVAGNFVLPIIRIPGGSGECDCILTAQSGALKSEVKIQLSKNYGTVPPIMLGQNYDFREEPPDLADISTAPVYDLNGDGTLNSLDLTALSNASSKKSRDARFDLNSDGKVDSKDMEVLKNQL